LWINGQQVATSATIQGDYTRYIFDVSQIIRPGKNSLAVKVYENQPDKMFTVDDVNWNELTPDHNTGIQFPITLRIDDGLNVSNAHVTQEDNADVSIARLSVHADVTNHTTRPRQGTVTETIDAPGGQGQVGEFSRTVTVAAGQTMTVSFTPSEYSELTINHPHLWWPYQMGSQPLYQLHTTLEPSQGSLEETFAIRSVTTRLIGRSAVAPDGARVFSINGTPVQFRGGGFDDDIFLRYSRSDLSNPDRPHQKYGPQRCSTPGPHPAGGFLSADGPSRDHDRRGLPML
jgi:exo-1,4-beta-D-glucosaminidase